MNHNLSFDSRPGAPDTHPEILFEASVGRTAILVGRQKNF
jgi:hypothetical protein